jgi:hypothetical protein
MRTGEIGVKLTACIITIVAIGSARQASASVYPTNTCVGAKMVAAGAYCQSALKAWSSWDKNQSNDSLDAALATAVTNLESAWMKAEASALNKGVDCVDTTLSLMALQSMVDPVVTDVVTEINDGLTLSNNNNAKCGSKLLTASAKKCAAMLKAESKYIKALAKDQTGAARDAAKTAATKVFSNAWDKATKGTCPTSATKSGVETTIDNLSDQVVTETTVSPNVDDSQFTTIAPTVPVLYLNKWLRPVCMDNSPYAFFVKRGSVNKLLMYYQGGGACWDQVTCGGTSLTQYQALCDTTVDPSGTDNPNDPDNHYGFGDLSNSSNPFQDWNIVFVSYCSCDIHYGDAEQVYNPTDPFPGGTPVDVVHHGFHNARVAEKWAREHFVNPEMVFVTGSSAGAYGAVFNAPLLEKVWPASQFRVLGDAGNGVITTDFLTNEFPNWNFSANLPAYIPGVIGSFSGATPTGMVGYIEAVAKFFPKTLWAHYATAFDGGTGGQTGFYNVMSASSYLTWPDWWQSSCDWHDLMVQQANDTYTAVYAENKNYRYYIGSGSRHTMWGSNKVYSDTTGGVPTIVDWINDMLTGTGWGNVPADPSDIPLLNVLLPGDPQPPTLPTEPFEQSGSNVIVNCGG